MGDFAHPMLVLQGMADAITDPQLAKEFHDRAASEVCECVGLGVGFGLTRGFAAWLVT